MNVKIAIYGAGAMGTVLGAFLTAGGLPVTLVTRNETHVKGLNKDGATIVCEADGIEKNIKVKAVTVENMGVGYDIIFLMTKQRYNAEIANFLLPRLAKDGIICTVQNGLPENELAKIFGNERVYGCVASYGARLIGGGRVALTSKLSASRVLVGGFENDNVKTDLLVNILSYAGKYTGNERFALRTDNLAGARWSKLCINSAFSGLSVVTGQTFGQIARGTKSKAIALGILRECMDIATAQGVTLENMSGYDMQKWLGARGAVKTLIAKCVLPMAMRKYKRLISGMRKDIEAGKKCEIDYINGAVCKAGKEVGVPTPLCDKVVEIVHGIENGLYETAKENLDFFI